MGEGGGRCGGVEVRMGGANTPGLSMHDGNGRVNLESELRQTRVHQGESRVVSR